ncbi:putative Zn(2)-C6 fungal-type domain-containing protein [Seiridium unicorne]|uniref:Zn(2)-C6 fungal-type domain-containing protein n=1 Tax=Seiridium unicorne TaxID=138068 RepID=A0ABR2VAS3_9PEZI
MQHSTVEGSALKSRKKNCDNCIQGKRRCDRQTPSCSRCAKKEHLCIYSKTVSASDPTKDLEHMTYNQDLETDETGYSLFNPGSSHNVDHTGGLSTNPHRNDAIEYTPQRAGPTTSSGYTVLDDLLGLVNNNREPIFDQWLVAGNENLLGERLGLPVVEEITGTHEKMSSFCNYIDAQYFYDPTTPLHYVINRVKDFTTDMATQSATPFLHQRLYRDYTPPCILSCFAATALYTNRTPANAAMIVRTLQAHVHELISTEGSRFIFTPVDKLARTQALFLYQIIRLFDGDIALRAQGEKDMPVLLIWLGELCKIRENLGDLQELEDITVRKGQPTEWERWIFAESVRRTIIMAYSVLSLYELLKDPNHKGDPDPWAYVHRWTLSRPLWEAASSFEFDHLWKENPPFVIPNYSFGNFLKHGRGEDVDEFAKILMSVYLGMDGTRRFISPQLL